MEFPCTGCGECCRRIQTILEANHEHPILGELVRRFPYSTRDDGACQMLDEGGRCSVYEHRPLLCNIKMGAVLMGVDLETWYRINADGCNKMIVEAGLNPSFLVSLKK